MNLRAESPEPLEAKSAAAQVTSVRQWKARGLYYHRARRGYRFDLARPRVVRIAASLDRKRLGGREPGRRSASELGRSIKA